MYFSLFINLNNDAFKEDPTIEVKRILKELNDHLNHDSFNHSNDFNLKDLNGNPVGTCEICLHKNTLEINLWSGKKHS